MCAVIADNACSRLNYVWSVKIWHTHKRIDVDGAIYVQILRFLSISTILV